MEQVLEQNRTLGQHLQLMEDRGPLDVRSVKFMDDAISIMSSRRSLRTPTNAWSMLSGLSLNDISVVSAFRLPITLNDVHLVAPGSTFSAMFMEQALPVRPQVRYVDCNVGDVQAVQALIGQTVVAAKKVKLSVRKPEVPVQAAEAVDAITEKGPAIDETPLDIEEPGHLIYEYGRLFRFHDGRLFQRNNERGSWDEIIWTQR
ncbi:hypothetical protein CGCS363_v003648 [Colletotrichum siamense]|uniref:uncharacterized protein n=1 Tax=Colletotrichum siamense TaxID=690259 RepID=UPI001872C38D|nr:uncharacterized protein CGCS363_v003648 [Colletotrichum siamense]KAF5510929.1 hypothetical protein CGCS363_v003648 [Colletotrichum siamense]